MKKIITVILLLMMFITGYAQRIVVYKQLDESLIKVSASSELNKGTICSVVNGDGMQGCYHVANNLGHGMWLSEVSKKPVRYNKSTHEGVVWLLCDFGKSRKCPEVDLIQIWNYNQNEHTRRGLNKVYIEYSEDGNKWQLLKNGDLEYYLIPESVGRNPGSVDFSLDTKGTFQNTKIFAGNYGIIPEGAFVPLDEEIIDIKGTVEKTYEIEPLLRVKWVGEPQVNADGTVEVKVIITRGTNNPDYQQPLTEAWLFVSETSYVGDFSFSPRFSTQLLGAALTDVLGKEITIKTKGQFPDYSRKFFLRVGARTTKSFSGTNRYNYTTIKEVTTIARN